LPEQVCRFTIHSGNLPPIRSIPRAPRPRRFAGAYSASYQ
jgi:hypothetical protein